MNLKKALITIDKAHNIAPSSKDDLKNILKALGDEEDEEIDFSKFNLEVKDGELYLTYDDYVRRWYILAIDKNCNFSRSISFEAEGFKTDDKGKIIIK